MSSLESILRSFAAPYLLQIGEAIKRSSIAENG